MDTGTATTVLIILGMFFGVILASLIAVMVASIHFQHQDITEARMEIRDLITEARKENRDLITEARKENRDLIAKARMENRDLIGTASDERA